MGINLPPPRVCIFFHLRLKCFLSLKSISAEKKCAMVMKQSFSEGKICFAHRKLSFENHSVCVLVVLRTSHIHMRYKNCNFQPILGWPMHNYLAIYFYSNRHEKFNRSFTSRYDQESRANMK